MDLSKSDYELILRLFDKTSESPVKEIRTPDPASSNNFEDDNGQSSFVFPYGELLQKRQNALSVNVFFTQGNWVFREDPELGKEGQSAKSELPHCYEIEFYKFHLFQLVQHAGMVRTGYGSIPS